LGLNVLVDGKQVREVMPGSESLLEVYGEVVSGLFQSGRTVVGVVLDGRVLSQEEQKRLVDGEQVEAATLEVRTMGIVELASDTLEEVLKHLSPLRESLEKAVRHLGAGERAEALEAFRPTLDIWLAACEAVQKVCLLSGIDPRSDIGSTTVEAAHQKVVTTLQEVQASFEQQDWVRLSDVLEYEMLPIVAEWEALVKSLLEMVQSDRP